MIRAIAAIDIQSGLTRGEGIIWDLPTDKSYFRSKTEYKTILMGYGEYLAQNKVPLPHRRNVVATHRSELLGSGFEKTNDARAFLKSFTDDIWIIGGAKLYLETLDLAEELYITQINKDFNCDKFFPEFRSRFKLFSETEPITENGISFTFQIWHKR